jgi:hypothetical protein
MGSAQQRILQYNLAYHDLKVIHSLRTSFMQLSTIWAFVANRKPWSHGGQCWDSDLGPCLPLQDNLPSLNVGEITCFEPIFKCDVEKRIGVEGHAGLAGDERRRRLVLRRSAVGVLASQKDCWHVVEAFWLD